MSFADTIDSVADALVDALQGVDSSVTVYKWVPGMEGMRLPAVTVMPPNAAPDAETIPDELGRYGWMLTFTVGASYELTKATNTQQDALEWVGQAIPAIVNDVDLNLLLEDEPRVTEVTSEFDLEAARPTFIYALTVTCPALVTY